MTGPDHFREAERHAKQADVLFDEYVTAHDDSDATSVWRAELIRRQAEHCREMGQLHATLALAAATALDAAIRFVGDNTGDDQQVTAWAAAIGLRPGYPAPAVVPDECTECETTGYNCSAHRSQSSAEQPEPELTAADLPGMDGEPVVIVDGWNGDRPVRIVRAEMDFDEVTVRYQDIRAHAVAHVANLPLAAPIRLVGGA
ncbi:hypothetical protein [Acrocarpospora sp. B8E8]|uniref:hypothetical protein n=1 Tax=Acrocarpospora sp. B8E8 TaxID=3153572 RepID=UPI00325C5843